MPKKLDSSPMYSLAEHNRAHELGLAKQAVEEVIGRSTVKDALLAGCRAENPIGSKGYRVACEAIIEQLTKIAPGLYKKDFFNLITEAAITMRKEKESAR